MNNRNKKRLAKKRRVRAKGTVKRPRLNVFRGNKIIYAQLIDDNQGVTLVAVNSQELKEKKFDLATAKKVGSLLAKKAKEKNITQAVFDRGGYQYHGKVKALAEGFREGGIKM